MTVGVGDTKTVFVSVGEGEAVGDVVAVSVVVGVRVCVPAAGNGERVMVGETEAVGVLVGVGVRVAVRVAVATNGPRSGAKLAANNPMQ